MASKANKDYFGLSWIVSLILAIIPFTSWVCGFVTRFKEGHWICALIRVFTGFWIVWLLDLIFMIVSHKIFRIN